MKKILNSKTKQELNLGDKINVTLSSPFGTAEVKMTVEKQNLEILHKLGIIEFQNNISTEPDYYVNKLINRFRHPETGIDALADLTVFSFITVYRLVAKEIAIEMDKKYSGHIKDVKILYFIDINTMKISSMSNIHLSDNALKSSAFFRTEEDAEAALKIMDKFVESVEDAKSEDKKREK